MIDKRRHYVLMLDTETANTLVDIIPSEVDEEGNVVTPEKKVMDMSSVLMYDCGWAVVDTKGNIYETASYVNRDIFEYEQDLMQSAYYANKIPRYKAELASGQRVMASTYEIRQAMLDTIAKYGIKEAVAHNARFDYNTLNLIQRYVTKSKFRYWFPFDTITFWDTMRMAQDVICNMPTYRKFCEQHGYVTESGRLRKTAEILYRYITGDLEFEESHTGLEDVLIEAEIMWYCFRQHKPMRKNLFEERNFPESTPFQRDLMQNLKQCPMLRVGY